MRLIDADKLMEELSKHNARILDARCVIAEQPTIETISGYRIEHLIWLAQVMSKEGVTPEELVELLKDTGRIIDMVLREQQEIFRRTVEGMIKNETDCR